MALEIARSPEEIDALREKYRTAAFKAEDAGDNDDVADNGYAILQWLFGDDDSDPFEASGLGEADDEDDPANDFPG
jgi:hypothetical protein